MDIVPNGNAAPSLVVTDLPATATPSSQANSVSVYGCDSIDLANQYSGTDFLGVTSGLDDKTSIGAMDGAVAAEIGARASGGDPVASANQGLQNNANKNEYVDDKDGDKVKRPDPKT